MLQKEREREREGAEGGRKGIDKGANILAGMSYRHHKSNNGGMDVTDKQASNQAVTGKKSLVYIKLCG